MSGIVGSAGSKSGVIGETEIDYEEGVVENAMIINGDTTATSYYSSGVTYVKIGNTVHLNIYLDGVDTDPGGQVTVTLPYANEDITSSSTALNNTASAIGALALWTPSAWVSGDNCLLYVGDAGTTVTIRKGAFAPYSTGSGDRIIMYGSITYRIGALTR